MFSPFASNNCWRRIDVKPFRRKILETFAYKILRNEGNYWKTRFPALFPALKNTVRGQDTRAQKLEAEVAETKRQRSALETKCAELSKQLDQLRRWKQLSENRFRWKQTGDIAGEETATSEKCQRALELAETERKKLREQVKADKAEIERLKAESDKQINWIPWIIFPSWIISSPCLALQVDA